MSELPVSEPTQSPTSNPQSEVSQLQHYINYVCQAILTAPDDYTRMIRTWVLALAEVELAHLVEAVGKKAEIDESEIGSTRTSSVPSSASSPSVLRSKNSLKRQSSPATNNSTAGFCQ